MKKVLKIVLNVLTVAMFALTILVLIMGISAARKNKPLKIFNYGYSVVVTDSMENTIMTNEIVFYKFIKFEDVKEQDIIVFYSAPDKINKVHRVVEIDEVNHSLTTRGDNVKILENDSFKVTEEYFYGKVIGHSKLLGIGNIVKNGRNIIFFVIIMIFLYIIITEVINILKLNNERQKIILEEQNKKNLELEKDKMREEILKELKEEEKKNQ